MKNQKGDCDDRGIIFDAALTLAIIVFIAIALALAFALVPVTNATPNPGGIPSPASAAATHLPGPENIELPVVSIHSAGNVLRGKTGTFILDMKPAVLFGGMYVNFSVGGTAVAGVDYVASAASLSQAYIGQSGYGVISFKTLPNPRGSSNHQAYSIVVKLEPGLGYALGESNSALIWIKDSPESDW